MPPYYYHHLHSGSSASWSTSFWGAFLGAFFAFVFGLITYVITKRRERFVIHKNALIKLDRALNKNLHDIGVLQQIIGDSERSLAQGHVTSNRLIKLQLPVGVDAEVGSIDLVNKLFVYQLSIANMDFNADSTNHSLTRLEDLFINGQPVPVRNFNFIRGVLQSLQTELPQFIERTKKFLVLIRIHQKKIKGKYAFVYGVFHSQWEQSITPQEIADERALLEREIAEGANQTDF